MGDASTIILAAEKPFRLGALTVRPAMRQLLHDDGRLETLEPRVMQVLTALAAARPEIITRDELTEVCWGGRIVGTDAINRVISRLHRAASGIGAGSFRLETITKVGYRLVVADSANEAEPATGAALTQASRGLGRRGVVSAGVGLLAAAGAVAGYRALRDKPKATPLIAVLPFDNLSRDPELGYFADGLAEDILNGLIRGGDVRVMARSSSFAFRGAAKVKAARALNVDFLLDGSVLREGSRMRIHVHLDDVARRQVLWSERYDRALGQGLSVGDEVAAEVAAALKVRFRPVAAGAAQLDDGQAFDFYLRGREATRVHSPASLQRGNELLRAAVARAPNFSAAWFELAKNYWRSGFLQPLPDQQRGFELGRQAARRAIELDPRNGAAFGVITQMTPTYGHWAEIDRGLADATRISPNDPNLVLWRAIFLFQTGQLSAAVGAARRAQLLDPLELLANHILCLVLTYTRAFGDAEAQAARLARLWPEQLATYWDRFWLLVAQGRDPEAIAWLGDTARRPQEELEEYEVLSEGLRAVGAHSAAQRRDAGRSLLALAQQGIGYAGNAMLLLAKLELFDEAIEVARSLYLRRVSLPIDHDVEFLGNSRFPLHGEASPTSLFHPLMQPLRRSGRLREIYDGLGLTSFWSTSGQPHA